MPINFVRHSHTLVSRTLESSLSNEYFISRKQTTMEDNTINGSSTDSAAIDGAEQCFYPYLVLINDY